MFSEESQDDVFSATVTAPVNIAVIKYWGKRDVALNLPTNSSFSVSLSQSDLCTRTTASCSRSYSHDELILNDEPCEFSAKYRTCIDELRALRRTLEADDDDDSLPPLSSYAVRIETWNNFPTASGLASSASGFAALVRAVASLYGLPTQQAAAAPLSRIARLGSGSACRSLFGGYVGWRMGARPDGADSEAYQLAPASHWPEMRMLVLVSRDSKKDVSSTRGMQVTVQTSDMFAYRAANLVPERMRQMEEAVAARDFATFGRLAMKDSNSFHALCLDSEPPIFYMDGSSRAAVTVVGRINEAAGEIIAAYTFDAGPNAVIFYLHRNRHRVAGVFRSLLSEKQGWASERGATIQPSAMDLDHGTVSRLRSGVKRVILTAVGEGPVDVGVAGRREPCGL
ncbi:Diphosphomevalonate decarboxylase [Lasiodiplodia theobromae]|uniref:Diphosphomevalonate decarboxylase n=1 Tax=Lasiodiplodia theobromae TaxID=45133 RepID=UPI0015C362DF|nr:Diphosphomevalonate decarboxylase [Lasiodiplodia theobromae]KAF4544437.1 Diphosphomevalonate decarboxylase [Lasiodiplodia theobromae]